MAHIWTPRYLQGAERLDRCREAVHDGGRAVTFHQCQRKAVIYRAQPDGKEYGFCRQHDPEVVRAAREKRHAEWQAKWDADTRRSELRKLRAELVDGCLDALRQIAAGHNDARSLAAEAIARLDACDSDTHAKHGDAKQGPASGE